VVLTVGLRALVELNHKRMVAATLGSLLSEDGGDEPRRSLVLLF